MKAKVRRIVEKCKKIKGFEIICALVIAAIAICIYFSVNAITDKAKNTQDSVATASTPSGLVEQIQDILSNIEGVGECQVLITYKGGQDTQEVDALNSTDNIQGVVVVAKGGGDVLTRIYIVNALCALLKIEANDIQIFEMK